MGAGEKELRKRSWFGKKLDQTRKLISTGKKMRGGNFNKGGHEKTSKKSCANKGRKGYTRVDSIFGLERVQANGSNGFERNIG